MSQYNMMESIEPDSTAVHIKYLGVISIQSDIATPKILKIPSLIHVLKENDKP